MLACRGRALLHDARKANHRLLEPRVAALLQGVSQGFIFVPLQALMLATIPMERLGNSTVAYDVAHILGGSRRVRFRRDARGRRRGEEEEEGARDPGLPAPAT